MPTVNGASLRAELDDAKARITTLRADGKVSEEVDAVIGVLLPGILVAVFLEKATPKTSRNSGLPPSQTARRAGKGSRGKGPKARETASGNLRTVTVIGSSPVTECRQCGHDLSATVCAGHEERVEIDIVFETVERRVEAEIKDCPRCRARNKGAFPDTMPGPLQYGPGIVACAVHLLCAQMVPFKRTAAMIRAMTGRLLSEATLLGFVSRLHQALEPWEAATTGKLLAMPVLNVDETSLRVDGKNHWIHVCSGGPVTVKRLHRKRGCEAIDDIGIIPRYPGVIVHDCWNSPTHTASISCAAPICCASFRP